MTMHAADFAAYHRPALEADEVTHNVMLAILDRVIKEQPAGFLLWTLGGPGECAVKTAGRPILLGNLSKAQCRIFAEDTANLDYPGVVGANLTAKWFVERASECGVEFADPSHPNRAAEIPGSERPCARRQRRGRRFLRRLACSIFPRGDPGRCDPCARTARTNCWRRAVFALDR
jgi:hypothetical protein